jgi:hypothetical protein
VFDCEIAGFPSLSLVFPRFRTQWKMDETVRIQWYGAMSLYSNSNMSFHLSVILFSNHRKWKYFTTNPLICLDLYQGGIYITNIHQHQSLRLSNLGYSWNINSSSVRTSGVTKLLIYIRDQKWINATSDSFYLMNRNQTSIGALYFLNPPSSFSVAYPSNAAAYYQQGHILEVKVQVPSVLIHDPLILMVYKKYVTGVITFEQIIQPMYVTNIDLHRGM